MSGMAGSSKRQRVVPAARALLLVAAVVALAVGTIQAIFGGRGSGICTRTSLNVQAPGPPARPAGGAAPSFMLADPVRVASCIDTVLPNLPLSPEHGCQSFSHHWDAKTGKWNDAIRHQALGLKKASVDVINTVLYIGGHVRAGDLAGLQRLLPGRPAHVLEPVPSFYAKLKSHHAPPALRTYNLGLANSTRDVLLPRKRVKGPSTVVMNSTVGESGNVSAVDAKRYQVLHLVSPNDFLSLSGLDAARDQPFLHVNCEGCEYEMFEALLDTGVIRMFPMIQASFHFVPEVPYRLTRYCAIRVKLEETHALTVDLPFGWERPLLQYTSSTAAFSNDQNGLCGRLIVAGAAALGRDFCAAVGLATILLGLMQDGAWLTASMHDRLLLGATDAALALFIWRAGCLHTEVLRRFGALGAPCPLAAGEHPAAAALAAPTK